MSTVFTQRTHSLADIFSFLLKIFLSYLVFAIGLFCSAIVKTKIADFTLIQWLVIFLAGI